MKFQQSMLKIAVYLGFHNCAADQKHYKPFFSPYCTFFHIILGTNKYNFEFCFHKYSHNNLRSTAIFKLDILFQKSVMKEFWLWHGKAVKDMQQKQCGSCQKGLFSCTAERLHLSPHAQTAYAHLSSALHTEQKTPNVYINAAIYFVCSDRFSTVTLPYANEPTLSHSQSWWSDMSCWI